MVIVCCLYLRMNASTWACAALVLALTWISFSETLVIWTSRDSRFFITSGDGSLILTSPSGSAWMSDANFWTLACTSGNAPAPIN
ncbi:Uncharacterised protein [Mycobacteroides abscessus subsp. bolletii]|nr:Uncharacterised protein [Mycobacteroides abscessus subsp. bolletii]